MSAPIELTLQVREWSLEEWLSSESLWGDLLGRSGLDPLFLSWEWLSLWWQHFGGRRTHELCILVAYEANQLVGIAPLYRQLAGRRLLPVRSIQFIGISWRDPSALISEYLDFISLPADRPRVRSAFLTHLVDKNAWSEMVISYTRDSKSWLRDFHDVVEPHTVHMRTIDHCISYQADLSDGFHAYLQQLGQSTRRSLWHLRRRLEGLGTVRFETIPADQIAMGFADLNELHIRRWGRHAFSGSRLDFHLSLARRLASRGELSLTRLTLDGRVVSVFYDVRKGRRQYNVKMAFDPGTERGFSLGLLHFGYAMEAAVSTGIEVYDFLAGRGRKTDYKRHLGQVREPLSTVQLLKGPILSRLYRWYDGRRHSPEPQQIM